MAAIPVFDVSVDIAARPLNLPNYFDEKKWELAEPFMYPFCGKIHDSQEHLRNHQLKCKPLKKVLVDVKKLQELRPMSVEPQTSQESMATTVTSTVMSENEAPEMDELIPSPAKKNKEEEGIDASTVEKIAKEMGMNVMRIDDGNMMPELKELPPNDSNMSVDDCPNEEDEKEDQILAEKDLNKSMSDEEYKQFLYTPPKACSTQKSASQESNKSSDDSRQNSQTSGQKRPWSG